MIGIICAMEEEINDIISDMTDKKYEVVFGKRCVLGILSKRKCVVCLSGVGKVNAAVACQIIIMRYNPENIINIGVVGAICNMINVGDIVIGKDVIQYDFDISAFSNRRKGEIPDIKDYRIPCEKNLVQKAIKMLESENINSHIGTILTGDTFINNVNKKYDLEKEFGGIVCDMEVGGVGQVCYINKIPFMALKTVSDNAMGDSHNMFENNLKTVCKKLCKITSKYISAL